MVPGVLKCNKRWTLPQMVYSVLFWNQLTLREIWMLYPALCLIHCWRKLIFFYFFFCSLPPLLNLNTEFSEHLQYPQMGVHHIPTILLRPGFNRTFIQSDQVWPDQQFWNRFICEPLWDEFPRLDFCGNGPTGNTTASFTAFSSLGSPPETKVCYHFYSAMVDTELILKLKKENGGFLGTPEDKYYW